MRYALDGSKLSRMGYKFPMNFEASLTKTIEWMVNPEHAKWLDPESYKAHPSIKLTCYRSTGKVGNLFLK